MLFGLCVLKLPNSIEKIQSRMMCCIHTDAIITNEKNFFKRICTSHFIVTFACERELETEQRLQYIDPNSYGCQRCVFLVLQGCLTGGPGAQLSAEWWLSLLHLIINWSPKLHWGSRRPLRPGVAFPTTTCLRRLWSPTVWLPVLTELYNSSTPTQSPT